MQDKEISISVVYLSYVPYGTAGLSRFLSSYTKHTAAYKHNLVILFKGMKKETELEPFVAIADGFNLSYQKISFWGEGFDLDAYRFAAGQLQDSYVLFFNSASVILAGDWLKKYAGCLSGDRQVVAATASAQSHYSSVFINHSWRWDRNRSFKYNFDKYKLFVKAFCYWKFLFPPFPNLHFRTNAFLINRELFASLDLPQTKNKFDAFKIESGFKSITSQLKKRGVNIVLLDKDGHCYNMQDWHKPAIFWRGRQQDLLVADKQTMFYQNSPGEEKVKLQLLAWGAK